MTRHDYSTRGKLFSNCNYRAHSSTRIERFSEIFGPDSTWMRIDNGSQARITRGGCKCFRGGEINFGEENSFRYTINERREDYCEKYIRANINFSKRRVSHPRNILHQIRINHANELSDFPRRRKTLLPVEKLFRAKIFHLQPGMGYLKHGKLKRSGQV